MTDRRLFHIADATSGLAFVNGATAELASPSLATEGFVHLSFAAQLAGTLDVHFRGTDALILIEVGRDRAAGALKLERSRGDALFPHLYRALGRDDIVRWWRIEREGATWSLPTDELDEP